MFDSQWFASLGHEVAGLLAQKTTWFVACVVFISGITRGFSGFGGALIFIPLTAAVLGPRKAVAVFYLFDLVSATPYGFSYLPKSRWREVAPMAIAAIAMLPVGAWVLKTTDPMVLRWIMAGLVSVMLLVLVTGWRYRGQPTPLASTVVGLGAGLTGGATGVSGPLVIAYWLSSTAEASVIRANIMVFYAFASFSTDVVYFFNGFFTFDVVVYALIAWPLYTIGLALGARFFKGTSDSQYRIAAYVLIALSVVFSLPLFDHFIR
ncbi:MULTISPECIES: sulfite exporter TauE/SafE family protein [unclassified Beijerinckia]|uniref:sulfite exporter TauE/SafE family protein n=1 Tax=unclassified Beijerinckia TaxID=2638183 RepID=UPI00089BCB26|nr:MULTISPECIES: sulfite exporter TauE/SafE family protein [unclassified Beijerinckia]MDH7799956.1 putative membrane protein YfcA [Beijerinckia sp. GAS462]SED43871.1 hypothetical protein SAMN05443249_5374 [Beijerinckia sp. 28-YEA-48]